MLFNVIVAVVVVADIVVVVVSDIVIVVVADAVAVVIIVVVDDVVAVAFVVVDVAFPNFLIRPHLGRQVLQSFSKFEKNILVGPNQNKSNKLPSSLSISPLLLPRRR